MSTIHQLMRERGLSYTEAKKLLEADGKCSLAGETGWLPLVRAQREYIEVLTSELSWSSKRTEAVRVAREKVAIAEAAANVQDELRPPEERTIP